MYTIQEAKDALQEGIKGYLLKDKKGNYVMQEVNRLPFYLEGVPGIGKTQIVSQIAEEMGIGFVSFSLVHHTRNSLLGLPVIMDLPNGQKYTNFTMSEIIAKVWEARDKEGKNEGILLLDEFPCMSDTILPTMLAFLQTKNIGAFSLPEGWVIVLCGNPREYNKSARSFDAAVTDRLRKIEIEFSVEDFLDYGKENGVHNTILEYLSLYGEDGYRCVKNGEKLELVTCRSWENLSIAIKSYEMLGQTITVELVYQFLKSEEIAQKFHNFYVRHQTGMNEEEFSKILNAAADEEIVNRYKQMTYMNQWKSIEYMLNYATRTVAPMLNELEGDMEPSLQGKKNRKKPIPPAKKKELMNQFAGQIDQLFEFAAKIEDSNSLAEQLFYAITNDEKLLVMLCQSNCRTFKNYCQVKYGA